MLILGLCVGGALGAPSRYLVEVWVHRRTRVAYPWGTWVVNVSGAFVLGALTGLTLYHHLPPTALTALGTGFCGAYTTFSTFTFETVRLVQRGEVGPAAVNVVLSVAAAIGAAALGLALVGLG